MKPTPEQLLEVARETGLRGFLHGVSATDARDLLGRFVQALQAKFPPVDYLCELNRFKLSFNRSGFTGALGNFRHQLYGRWVALVPAENDAHMYLLPGSRPELELAHGVHYTERKLVEGVLRNMKQQNLGRHRRPRWAVITQVFGVGSGVAHGICREFGYDPEEMI